MWTPGARLAGFIKSTTIHCYTHSSGHCGFGEEDFLCFSQCKCMGANDPRGGAISDPRGMIGRINKKDQYTLLHTKYESSGLCCFGEEFFILLPQRPTGRVQYGPQGHDQQDL